tara:strand:+ start:3157 stop:3426 length:270 start_codon:yes stop_codon:yes gene_type:complete
MTTIYSLQELLIACITVWREEQMKYNPDFGANETLYKLKELCEKYDTEDKNLLKTIFEECESSMKYDIETDEISYEADETDDEEFEECE